MIKSERFGLWMVGAALLVVAVVVGLWFDRQADQKREHIRSQGVVLVRVLSSLPYDQLLPRQGSPNLLQTVLQMNRGAELGYGLIVDAAGATLSEVTSAGAIVPAAAPPRDAGSWFGERQLVSPGDGRRIREFHGPVLDKGEIAGYVRLGYFDSPVLAADLGQVSFAAMLALPVFLLVPLFHLMMKRELRPLRDLGAQLQQLAGGAGGGGAVVNDMRSLLGRFARFIDMTHARIREIEAERFTAQTSKHMLAYRQEKVESVLHALPEALLVLDDAGTVSFANARLQGLLGVDPGAIIGLPAREALPQPEAAAFLERCAANPAQALRAEALEFQPAADSPRRIAASAYPLFSPRDPQNALGLLVAFRDVTAEAVGRQAGAEFVAHVSHELKSPLNVLKMYSELLLEDGGESREQRIEAVNVIRDEVERMAELIGNLLNVSKIEQGAIALDRQRVRLGDLLQDLAARATRAASAKGVEIRLAMPPDMGPVMLDKDLARIAIGNLLSNAIKYNRAGGSVTLSAEEQDAHIAIRVRDTGIGIERAELAKVFGKFFRAAGAGAAATGHGLGLYLAKQIAELHQGSIAVSSEPGQGTEFCLLLARRQAPAEETVAL